jgi:hypothetical protein
LHPAGLSGKDRVVSTPDRLSPHPGVPPLSRAGERSQPTMSSARRALVEFAGRSPATQADVDQVMRALVTHDDWYVPVLFADRAWGQRTFDREYVFAEAEPTKVLNVFTDHESASLAEGQALGVYGGPVSGVRLMHSLDPGLEALIVNPASPREHQWYIASGGFDIAITWATAIAAERALANRGNGAVPVAELLSHRYHLLLEKASRAMVSVHLPDIDGAVNVCFTAADRVEEFIASLPPPARSLADLAVVEGPALFETMRGVGAAGLVVNAGSDDQTALTSDDIAEIIG